MNISYCFLIIYHILQSVVNNYFLYRDILIRHT
nr:MAG TPA: hypothetical protein [Bacteriophage sp.]